MSVCPSVGRSVGPSVGYAFVFRPTRSDLCRVFGLVPSTKTCFFPYQNFISRIRLQILDEHGALLRKEGTAQRSSKNEAQTHHRHLKMNGVSLRNDQNSHGVSLLSKQTTKFIIMSRRLRKAHLRYCGGKVGLARKENTCLDGRRKFGVLLEEILFQFDHNNGRDDHA